jgi:hypothetical protein
MEKWTTNDWIMVRDALRWYSDQQERAARNIPNDPMRKLSDDFNAWRRRLADEIQEEKLS